MTLGSAKRFQKRKSWFVDCFLWQHNWNRSGGYWDHQIELEVSDCQWWTNTYPVIYHHYCTIHCSSDISNQRTVSVVLFLHLCQRQRGSVQAAKVVSSMNSNSAIWNYDTLCLMQYYDTLCLMLYYVAQYLMYYHHGHNLVYLFYRCQHWVSELKLPVSSRQCLNHSLRDCTNICMCMQLWSSPVFLAFYIYRYIISILTVNILHPLYIPIWVWDSVATYGT